MVVERIAFLSVGIDSPTTAAGSAGETEAVKAAAPGLRESYEITRACRMKGITWR